MPRVVHFEICADEPDRAVEFYQSVFDWEIRRWDGPLEYWLIITGEDGEPGINGGVSGDLYVVIKLAPHPIFERTGDDVVCSIPVSFPQAALGSTIEVPTLLGKVQMKVPAGTQSGKTFRLRKKGFPNVDGRGQGDQMVTVTIETPTNLTPRQEELLRAFADEAGVEVQPERKGFMDRMKELFN